MKRVKPMLVTGYINGDSTQLFVDAVMGFSEQEAAEAVAKSRVGSSIINVTNRAQVVETLRLLEAVEEGTVENILYLDGSQ